MFLRIDLNNRQKFYVETLENSIKSRKEKVESGGELLPDRTFGIFLGELNCFFLYELFDGDEYRALLKDLYYIYAGNSESDPVFGQTLKMTKRFGQHLKANDAFYDFLYGKNIGEIRAMNILGKLSPQQKEKYFEVERSYGD